MERGELSIRGDLEDGAMIALAAVLRCAVEVSVPSKRKSSPWVLAVGLIETVQRSDLAAGGHFENGATTVMRTGIARAAIVGCSEQGSVRPQDERVRLPTFVRPTQKSMQNSKLAGRCDLEGCAPNVAETCINCCPVQISVCIQNQPIRSAAIVPVREVVESSQAGVRSEFKDCAEAVDPACSGCAVQVSVRPLN